jgi:hypothetical protein
MFDELVENTNRYDGKITASTVQRVRATLRRALNAATAHGYLNDNPARMLELPSPRRSRPVIWSERRRVKVSPLRRWARVSRACRPGSRRRQRDRRWVRWDRMRSARWFRLRVDSGIAAG